MRLLRPDSVEVPVMGRERRGPITQLRRRVNPAMGRNPTGKRDHGSGDKSRMRRESHVRFREGLGVKFPRATRLVVTAPTREVLETYVRPRIEEFLRDRGLTISEAKTRIVDLEEGFNSLGLQIRRFAKRTLTVPQKEKVLKHLQGIKSYLGTNQQAPAGKVIGDLNPVLRGWANYYRYCAAQETFSKVRHRQWQMLWRWAKRRHPGKPSKWVKRRYFRNDGSGTFYDGEWNLFKPDSTPITRYTKVIGKHSPYDPTLHPYWAERNAKQVIAETFSPGRRVLHQRQDYRCALCDLPFVPGERIPCDHLIFQYRGGSDDLDNKRLVHPWCHMQHHQRIGFKGHVPPHPDHFCATTSRSVRCNLD